jgi:hypothetical protein
VRYSSRSLDPSRYRSISMLERPPDIDSTSTTAAVPNEERRDRSSGSESAFQEQYARSGSQENREVDDWLQKRA